MPRLFIIIILFFGAAIIGLFYLVPEWKKFSDLRQEIEGWNDLSVELDELIQNRDALIETINTIPQDNLKRLNTSLPEGPNSSNFLVVLENLSVTHGLILKRVDLASFVQTQTPPAAGVAQPKPSSLIFSETSAKAVKEFPINLNLEGTYDAFKTFLSDLEKNTRIIDIQEISFSSSVKAQNYEFFIKAKTYYQ